MITVAQAEGHFEELHMIALLWKKPPYQQTAQESCISIS